MKVTKTEGEQFELDIKRFYAPFKLEKTCECGKVLTIDLNGQQYLHYPTVGKPIGVNFYCDECGNEYSGKVVLGISLNAVEEVAK